MVWTRTDERDWVSCSDSDPPWWRALGDRIAKVRVAGSNPVFRSKTLRLHYDGRTGVEKRKAVSALELSA